MTYDEMIAVIQAAKVGKPIEAKRNDGSNIPWTELQEVGNFNFMEYEYRVKKEPSYRPFKNADEAFNEAKKHGFWVKENDFSSYLAVTFCGDIGVCIVDNQYTYEVFFGRFSWADTGEPCGILEE